VAGHCKSLTAWRRFACVRDNARNSTTLFLADLIAAQQAGTSGSVASHGIKRIPLQRFDVPSTGFETQPAGRPDVPLRKRCSCSE
jgi:hypothetical protein